jgi:NAD(P)-dependent dehydrogenase (short-subunit alcohol dehydrogenase family)
MPANDVLVVIGMGGMGRAVARRLGAGRTVVLADINEGILDATAAELVGDGHQVVTRKVDVSSHNSVTELARLAAASGRVTHVVHTAGLSPEQGSVAKILAVDLLGVALTLEEFGRVIEPGGSGSSSRAWPHTCIRRLSPMWNGSWPPHRQTSYSVLTRVRLIALPAASSLTRSPSGRT